MNELRRMAYLEAMGVQGYVSRAQLPGAAETRRLAIVRPGESAERAKHSAAEVFSSLEQSAPALQAARSPENKAPKDKDAAPTVDAPRPSARPRVDRFTLAAIVAGDFLWLEDLGDMPLGKDQVWLIEAISRALALASSGQDSAAETVADLRKSDIAQFKWPIHQNAQLGLDRESAQATVASFVERRLTEFRCRGLILLGEGVQRRLPSEPLNLPIAVTHSTAEILSNSSLKPAVWLSLRPLVDGVR